MQINEKQRVAFRAVCDAIVREIAGKEGPFWGCKATDNQTPERILASLDALTKEDQKQLDGLFSLLTSPLLGLTWGGPLKPFAKLSPAQQESLLLKWNSSWLGPLRQAFHSLRKLTVFHFFGYSDGQPNPAWAQLDYPGPPMSTPQSETSIPISIPKEGDFWSTEVLVIGSGSGGGLAAGMLAEAGHEVLVIEKGPYLKESEMNQRESEMVSRLYDRGGALSSQDGGITIFAGSCLGGGTTVNWAGSFPTPEYVVEEWAKEHQLPELLEPSFRESMQAVMQAMHVNTEESPHNGQNTALWEGSQKLNQAVHVIARNTHGCNAHGGKLCGWCGYGCRNGSKQGTVKTWLSRAAAKDAKFIVNATVTKIISSGGKATGVEATYVSEEGRPVKFRVLAKKVICSAGSIHTPALLLRSGMHHPQLGKNLYLHPVVAVSGLYDTPILPWEGVMMSAVNDQYAKITGNFGFRLETPPTHPGLMAMALPWNGAEEFKEILSHAAYSANFIVLTRDKFGGKVTVNPKGLPVVSYKLHEFDRKHLIQGTQEAARVHLAAGAREVLFPNYKIQRMLAGNSSDNEAMIQQAPNWGWRANQVSLFSAHQMGTCRMGGKNLLHPVNPEGELRQLKNLYIVDSSVFPAASGANPMVSVMTFAHFITKKIIHQLKSER